MLDVRSLHEIPTDYVVSYSGHVTMFMLARADANLLYVQSTGILPLMAHISD